MDSQFRCGKCGKPISSKYAKCLDCGSLGPHTFSGSTGSAVEGGPPAAQPPRRRDTYPADQIEKQQPPVSRPPQRYEAAEPVDIRAEPPHPHPSHDFEDDSRFPVGMRSRSPILDYVENVDESEGGEQKRRPRKETDWNSEDESEDRNARMSYDEDLSEKRAPEKSNSTLTLVISIILIMLLIIAVLYTINNYDALTKWLASPTVPEVFKPSQ